MKCLFILTLLLLKLAVQAGEGMFHRLPVSGGEIVVSENPDKAIPTFDETSLTLVVENVGSIEIPSVISGQTAYLSVDELFTFLKVKNIVSSGRDSVSGFFTGPDDLYTFDIIHNAVVYKDKVFKLNEYDLFKTPSHIFINIKYLYEIFGLECTFYLKSLSVNLKTQVELPIFKELRQEAIRKSIRKMKGEFVADSMVNREYPLLSLGTIDWAFYPTMQVGKHNSNEKARMYSRIAMGGFLAGGEVTLGINHYSDQPLVMKYQYYRWRFVNNNNPLLRQVSVGKIAVQSISSIFSPVIGVQVTNAPTKKRNYYGMYRINENALPGQTVELYVNNVLVDYTMVDPSGHFIFDVPLSYGNTEVKLRYFGQWGEEKAEVKQIHIPYTFIPRNQLEYTFSAGTPEDNQGTSFYRGILNYGISRKITLGVGNEYLSSIPSSSDGYGLIASGKNIPFVLTSLSLAPNLLLNAEYALGVRAKSMLNWRTSSNFMMELSYTKYEKGQKAISYNYREERKASFSKPFKIGAISMFSRLAINQMVINDQLSITLSDFVLAANYKKVNMNIHTYGTFVNTARPVVYSDVSVGLRMPLGISVTPSIRYSHTFNRITGWRLKAEKSIFRQGYLTVNYEQYNDYNIKNLQVGFRIVFKGAQAALYMNHQNNAVTLNSAINGSLVYDKASRKVMADNINKVGRGGITILAFLDLNGNGKRDDGEPRVKGLTARVISGGQPEISESDTLIRIFNLEAYTHANLVVSGVDFENIFWQLPNTSFSVAIDPNSMRLLEVPVIIAKEVGYQDIP